MSPRLFSAATIVHEYWYYCWAKIATACKCTSYTTRGFTSRPKPSATVTSQPPIVIDELVDYAQTLLIVHVLVANHKIRLTGILYQTL